MSRLDVEVEVRRSMRRRRTVTAYREGDRVVVCVPGRFTAAEEGRWVQVMLERLAAQERRRSPSDERLLARARDLSRRFLDGRCEPTSVRWSADQGRRWGSCTPADGSIRVSDRVRGMPGWVLDYVLVHELAHLAVTGHGPRFWALVDRYPRTERARGFLDGVAHAAGLDVRDDGDDGDNGDDGDADEEVPTDDEKAPAVTAADPRPTRREVPRARRHGRRVMG